MFRSNSSPIDNTLRLFIYLLKSIAFLFFFSIHKDDGTSLLDAKQDGVFIGEVSQTTKPLGQLHIHRDAAKFDMVMGPSDAKQFWGSKYMNTPSSEPVCRIVNGTGNNISNIDNADIKAAAAIDATKIADGTVTNAEFQYINSLSSNAQDQIDLKAALASPALTGDPTAPTQSASDNSTKLATTAYVDGQVATENELSELNDVTIAGIADANYLIYDNAASVWKNKAISGAFTSDNLGVTTLSALIDATKIADGTVTSTEFQYINTLSSNAQDQIDTKATAGFAVAMAIAL